MKYTVMSGDTMYKIATQFGVSLDELLKANPDIASPDLIFPGQVIEIPILEGPGGEFPIPELPPEIPPGIPPVVSPPCIPPGFPEFPGFPPGGMMPGMPGGMMPGMPGGMMPGMPGGMMPGMPGGMMPGMPGVGFSLKLGDKGQEVKYLQNRLKDLGYYDGKISGRFGPRTKNAVRKFQKDCQIDANGIVNGLVWQVLG